MTDLKNKNLSRKIASILPLILLYVSVLNTFDFNYLGLKYFSFNFSYILIFYYNLKKSESLGYTAIFIAGLFNDVIVGTPMGMSSLIYLLICGAAVYLRNITLRPNLMKDWFFFLVTILILNSLSFLILTLIFDYKIDYIDQVINITFTFLFYLIFSYLFSLFARFLVGSSDVR